MHFAHVTLPTQHVERTCAFLVKTLRLEWLPTPQNSPVPVYWLDLGHGQELHVFHVPGFEVSPFETEFGRHIALLHPTRRRGGGARRAGARDAVRAVLLP
jgi:catechol 2,3-dioxygenase-like lactoylglutathione lyase family enzyme